MPHKTFLYYGIFKLGTTCKNAFECDVSKSVSKEKCTMYELCVLLMIVIIIRGLHKWDSLIDFYGIKNVKIDKNKVGSRLGTE